MATLAFKAEGEVILLAGAPPSWGTHLGQSIYLREILGREDGPPPPVDLAHEKRVGDFVRGLIRDGLVTAVHDLLRRRARRGPRRDGDGLRHRRHRQRAERPVSPLPVFFGEDQGRYVVTVPARRRRRASSPGAKAAGVFMPWIGKTGGSDLKLGDVISISVAKLREAHENWFPAFMAGEL